MAKRDAFKCVLVEAVGTFLFALAVFSGVDPLAAGLVLMAALYIGSHGHEAQLNSAVSFAGWFSGRMSFEEFAAVVGGQIVGALGAAVLTIKLGGGPHLGSGAALRMMGLTEVITAFVFVSVAMVLLDRFKSQEHYGLILGLTATGLIKLGGYFNPSLAIGCMLHSTALMGAGIAPKEHIIAYIVMPLVGAALAVWYGDYVHGSKK